MFKWFNFTLSKKSKNENINKNNTIGAPLLNHNNDLDEKEISELIDWVITSFTAQQGSGNDKLLVKINNSPADSEESLFLKNQLKSRAKELLILRDLPTSKIDTVLKKLVDYLWGLYRLQPLIDDEDISDVGVLAPDCVNYKKNGIRMTSDISFIDKKDYIKFINVITSKNQINIAEINAIKTFTDKISNSKFILRYTITTAFVNSVPFPYLSIRKHSKDKNTIDMLIEKKMMNRKCADYVVQKVKSARGIIIIGCNASGKTTLLNTMIEEIPHTESIYCTQESEELFTLPREKGGHPNMKVLHTVTASGEGKVNYTLSDLLRSGLKSDNDVFIVGEITGDEVEGFSMASFTGGRVLTTTHGQNTTEGMTKFADYLHHATGYSFEDCYRTMSGIDTAIFVDKFKIEEITEFHGFNEETKQLNAKTVFKNDIWDEEVKFNNG